MIANMPRLLWYVLLTNSLEYALVCLQVCAGCCKKAAMCVATGDPHYVSFDGKHLNFYGLGCFYLLKTPAISLQTKLE